MSEFVRPSDSQQTQEIANHTPVFESFYFKHKGHFLLKIKVTNLPPETYTVLAYVPVLDLCDPFKQIEKISISNFTPHNGYLEIVIPLVNQSTRKPLVLKKEEIIINLLTNNFKTRYGHTVPVTKEVSLASQAIHDILPEEPAQVLSTTGSDMKKEKALRELTYQAGLLEKANELGYQKLEGVVSLLQTIINIQDTEDEETLRAGVGIYKKGLPQDFYRKQATLETWATEEIIEAMTTLSSIYTVQTLWDVLDKRIEKQFRQATFPTEEKYTRFIDKVANGEIVENGSSQHALQRLTEKKEDVAAGILRGGSHRLQQLQREVSKPEIATNGHNGSGKLQLAGQRKDKYKLGTPWPSAEEMAKNRAAKLQQPLT